MIICRLYVGGINTGTPDKPVISTPFQSQIGTDSVVYVIDELAIKNLNKHRAINGISSIDPNTIVQGEFRSYQGYSIATFLDKCIKPIMLKEQFGVHTVIDKWEREDLVKFAENWRVAVDVPANSTAIPVPAWGMLVPATYQNRPNGIGPVDVKEE